MLEAIFSVNVLFPLPGAVILAGEKVAVTPLGRPLTEKVIAELNPLTTVVANANEADPPGATLALAGLMVMVKLRDATVTAKARVRVSPPPVPVKVSV